eukprot:1178784-Prorocentrum_minimum.AAC.2
MEEDDKESEKQRWAADLNLDPEDSDRDGDEDDREAGEEKDDIKVEGERREGKHGADGVPRSKRARRPTSRFVAEDDAGGENTEAGPRTKV